MAPGASSSVSLFTSFSVAGSGSGTLRLELAGSGWLYRDYDLSRRCASGPGLGHGDATSRRRHRALLGGIGAVTELTYSVTR